MEMNFHAIHKVQQVIDISRYDAKFPLQQLSRSEMLVELEKLDPRVG